MRPYRTVLEQKIRERRMTLEEFAAYAENFAREHGEPGTLSLRHLQRLVSGKGPRGKPLGPVRRATARLLERIFKMESNELLAPPVQALAPSEDETVELRERIQKARSVDTGLLQGFREQLNTIRRIDRQYGAIVTHNELLAKISQASELFTYSLTDNTRRQLAILLSEMHALAGWQSLDMGHFSASWHHYERAKSAALEDDDVSYHTHAAAEQAFTLIDLGYSVTAVDLLKYTRKSAQCHCPPLLRAWLAAAHGEALAAANRPTECLERFDEAERHLPRESANYAGPYLVLDINHLARWRGHSTSRSEHGNPVSLLQGVLELLDPTFARAESALRVDLAAAMAEAGETRNASEQLAIAKNIAADIGSMRQLKRINNLLESAGH